MNNRLDNAIQGALRSAVDAHGPLTRATIGSATKRIRGAIGTIIQIRHEDSYWAEVPSMPGCFAAADTIPELLVALAEAVTLWTEDAGGANNSEGETGGGTEGEGQVSDRRLRP